MVDEEAQRWELCRTDANLRTPPGPGTPGNCPPGADLDLRLGWDRFEKLLLEVVHRVQGLRGLRFRRYGVPGQAQYGIDIAGRDPDGDYIVVQCKDYQTFTASNLRAAVTKFTTGGLPFRATHLIVATSAPAEETQVYDELAALEEANPDLTIELWDAVEINRHLRRLGDVVSQFWTRETATTFCTAAPLAGTAVPTPDRQEQANRALVGPLQTSDVAARLNYADQQNPADAADIYAELAQQLENAGFQGHGSVLRDRQINALQSAGQITDAATVTIDLLIAALDRDYDEPRRLLHRLKKILEDGGTAVGGAQSQLNEQAALFSEATSFLVDPLARPEDFADLLSQPSAASLPQFRRLVLVLAEGLLAAYPKRITEIDELLRRAVAQAGTGALTELDVRLRMVLAEYDQPTRRDLRAGRRLMMGRLAALINAREARLCALESRAEDALDSWRDAVYGGIHEGLADDAADWLYAIRTVNTRLGPWTTGIDDEHHLAQALRGTSSDHLLSQARRPSERAQASALAGRPIEAVLYARQWLTDAVTTADWVGEIAALNLLGDLYRDNAEPQLAAEMLARSGSTKRAAALAAQADLVLIPAHLDLIEPWWTTETRIAILVAQADLLPDADASVLLDQLTDLALRGRAGELVEPGPDRLTNRAVDGACALAHRGSAEQARAVLALLSGDIPREPRRFRFSDDAHAAACIEIAIAHPDLAVPALTRLFDLAKAGADRALQGVAHDRVRALLREPAQDRHPFLPVLTDAQRAALRPGIMLLAETPPLSAKLLRHELAPDDDAAQETARLSGERILSRSDPTPNSVTFGSEIKLDAYLARLLDVPTRVACINKLLQVAEDQREIAINRREALQATMNLVATAESEIRAIVWPRATSFVTGHQDGSAHDGEMTGSAHPLSAFQFSSGTATLRGPGLRLAAAAIVDDENRRWVREQAVSLLGSTETTDVACASQVLASLPPAVTGDLDADLLAHHPHVNVRQLSAILSLRTADRYEKTARLLAKDSSPRVRYALTEAIALTDESQPSWVADLAAELASDPCYSVRSPATMINRGREVRSPE